MRYFYSKLGPMGPDNIARVVVTTGGAPFEGYIDGLDDPRIRPGSVQEYNEHTGWLEIDAPHTPTPLL